MKIPFFSFISLKPCPVAVSWQWNSWIIRRENRTINCYSSFALLFPFQLCFIAFCIQSVYWSVLVYTPGNPSAPHAIFPSSLLPKLTMPATTNRLSSWLKYINGPPLSPGHESLSFSPPAHSWPVPKTKRELLNVPWHFVWLTIGTFVNNFIGLRIFPRRFWTEIKLYKKTFFGIFKNYQALTSVSGSPSGQSHMFSRHNSGT